MPRMKIRPLVLAALLCVAAFVSGERTSAATQLASTETASLARARSSLVVGVIVPAAKGLTRMLVGWAKS
jgi:hypothetical protein